MPNKPPSAADRPDPAAMRRSYDRDVLDEASAPASWLPLFTAWFDAAADTLSVVEANAMQVATVDADGHPDVRTVLLKGFDERGWTFFTNYDSAKGRALSAHDYAAAVLAWVPLERQVRLRGPVTRVSREETEEYFATRPRGSQLGAWASPQSQPVPGRAALEALVAETEQRFGAGPVPAPPFWGGYRIAPETVEFWQGRRDRLHDRLRYTATGAAAGAGWQRERLAP